jgi:hypothetical protein
MEGEPMMPADVLSEAQADAVLSGQPLTEAASRSLNGLQVLVAALRAPAQPGELAGQAQTVEAFSAERQRLVSTRVAGRAPRRAGKVVAITTAVVVAFSGAAAAAVTAGVLPGAPWRHQPAPGLSTGSTGGGASGMANSGSASDPNGSATASAAASPTGTDALGKGQGIGATGEAAFGLCLAYSNHPDNTSVEMRRLAAAAAAAGQSVPQYCEVVLAQHPGQASHAPPSPGQATKPPHPSSPAGTGPSISHTPHPSKSSKPSDHRSNP